MILIDKHKQKEKIILDTSAFISGFNPNLYNSTVLTTNEVLLEIRNAFQKELINSAILRGTLIIRTPSSFFIKRVNSLARTLGESGRLSETDKGIIALALEEQENGNSVIVYTNDYSIMNVLKKLNIKFKAVGVPQIKRVFKWRKFCPSCKKVFPASFSDEFCPICGTKLKKISIKSS
ncbi:MAG: NOB1 family endonuclease [Candidatus Asgardarchaeia archaeon]